MNNPLAVIDGQIDAIIKNMVELRTIGASPIFLTINEKIVFDKLLWRNDELEKSYLIAGDLLNFLMEIRGKTIKTAPHPIRN